MSTAEALTALEAMSDKDFNAFLSRLPARVQMIVRGGLSDWRTVLPEWYIQSQEATA